MKGILTAWPEQARVLSIIVLSLVATSCNSNSDPNDDGPDPQCNACEIGCECPTCGNGVCDPEESCTACASDCGACPTCAASGDTGIDCADCGDGCEALWVSADGSDENDGSKGSPWKTITHALSALPTTGGQTVCVEDGTYSGAIESDRAFTEPVWVKAVTPYKAVLTADDNPVIEVAGTNLGFEGFEIVGQATTSDSTGLVYIDETENFSLRNNVIHDSYHNDLLRILGANGTTLECNVLYNQADDEEHLDINQASRNTFLYDNIFFNDYAASERTISQVQSFIVIKLSGVEPPPVTGDVFMRRNIFMHYEGGSTSMLQIGADGEAFAEAEDIVLENNLFLYNGDAHNGGFDIRGAANVTVRANTLVGNGVDEPFAGAVYTSDGSPPAENVFIYNNVFARADGNMGVLLESPPDGVTSGELLNNLYWNGGQSIPTQGDFFDYTEDAQPLIANPELADPADAPTPVWDGESFANRWSTVREAFEALVRSYAKPGANSGAIDAADASKMPVDDILGNSRGSSPDIGAYEAD